MINIKAVRKLRRIFLDEEVTIYLRDVNVVTVDEEGQQVKVTAMAQGYVLDIDENFYYLGLPNGTITRTINHDIAQMVEILFEASEYMDSDIPLDEDIH
jgi:transposase